MGAQLAIRVIHKAVEAYRRDLNIRPEFRQLGAIQYDQRSLSWKGLERVSMVSLTGRITLKTRIGDYQRTKTGRLRGQADLIYRRDTFYLIAVVDVREEELYEAKGTLGVDLGIENLATDSDGQIFKGMRVEKVRKRFNRLRRNLQKIGTRSAKRKFRKMSGHEKRFKRDINHQISKAIVSKAKGTTRAIALEDLKGIRSRVTVRHGEQRDRHNKWSFGQLRQFIEYKARKVGVPLYTVEARNTSRTCPKCNSIDVRNRPERNDLKCIRCGYRAMADYVAAINIAARAPINEPIVAALFSPVTSPETGRLMTV